MALTAHLQGGDGQRSSPRRDLRLTTKGRFGDGAEANVIIHNLSAAGLLLETALELAVGEELAIDLPEAGTVDAVIVWQSQRLYGCAFKGALGGAALAAAQLRSLPSDTRTELPAGDAPNLLGSSFSHKINRLRRERGLTLADVATALGVSKPTVWAWEKGKARPVPERLDAIAAVLGVTAAELQETSAANAEGQAVIEECRQRIAAAFNCAPAMVRIMLEL